MSTYCFLVQFHFRAGKGALNSIFGQISPPILLCVHFAFRQISPTCPWYYNHLLRLWTGWHWPFTSHDGIDVVPITIYSCSWSIISWCRWTLHNTFLWLFLLLMDQMSVFKGFFSFLGNMQPWTSCWSQFSISFINDTSCVSFCGYLSQKL